MRKSMVCGRQHRLLICDRGGVVFEARACVRLKVVVGFSLGMVQIGRSMYKDSHKGTRS